MIRFTDRAREKVKGFIEANNQPGVALRILITERNEKGFKYNFQLETYEGEKDSDITIREGGFATRLDPETLKGMKGSTVDWKEENGKAGFHVDNPNPPVLNQTPDQINEQIVEALKTVFDPEIPVNIYDLGLIYNVDFDPQTSLAKIKMTLTAPNCPAAEQLPADVKTKVSAVPGVKGADVELTWDPPWDKDKMSEVARIALNM